jgi:hypothetical protein
MQKIPNDTSFIAEWIQPGMRNPFYELQCGNLYLGTLEFQSSFSSLAFAETADGKWSFKQVGVWNPRMTIREQGKQENIATYQSKIWSSKICFNNGKTYIWKSINFWSTQWAFINSAGEVMSVVKPGVAKKKFSGFFKTQVTMEIYPSKETEGNITLLLPFALYLIILQQKAAAVAAI